MTKIQAWTLGISLVGAAAWLPHLILLAVKFLRKPKLTIIPSRTCQIGFTELGPIFNINVAITAEYENVLIDSIEFKIVHESGDSHLFRWHEITEIKGQMVIPGIQNEPIYQESEAIAIKILPTDFKSLLFKNRLEKHTQGYKDHIYAFNRERRRLVNSNQYDPNTFYSLSTVQNMQAFLESQMIWKKGKYQVSLLVHNKNKAEATVPSFSFELSDEDIVLLQVNCSNMPKLVKNMCLVNTPQKEKKVDLGWHWLNKDLSMA